MASFDPDHHDHRIDPSHKTDSGWDCDYCPALPVHDISNSATTPEVELFLTGNADLLVYDRESNERVFTLSPAETDALREVLCSAFHTET